MKRSFCFLLVALVLAACREVRHDGDPTSEDAADAAAVSTGGENDAGRAQDASAPNTADSALSSAAEAGTGASALDGSLSNRDAGASDANRLDASANDASPLKDAGSLNDAAPVIDWFDGGILPLTPDYGGAWPAPNGVEVPPIDAGSDPGCTSTPVTNERGVGGICRDYARSLACPATHTCTEALALRGLNMASPYYCSRPCLEDAHCGQGASCCSVPGIEGKACIMDGCRYACRKSP